MNNLKDNMKLSRILKTILNEGRGMSFEDAKALAIKQSKENGNAVQHVNEIGPDEYVVEDWYDDEKTVWSCEGSRVL